jgi:hypothetical protein
MGLFRAITNSIGLTKPKFDAPTLPNQARPMEMINEILGVTSREVEEEITLEDGTKKKVRKIVTDLNLTPEQQARMDALNTAYDEYLVDLQSLTDIEAAIDDPAFEPVVTAVRTQQSKARNEAAKEALRVTGEALTQRGLQDSTTAIENVRQISDSIAEQAATDENQLVLLAEQLRNEQVTRTGAGLEFAANQLQQSLANQQNESQFQRNLQVQQQGLTDAFRQNRFSNQLGVAQQKLALDQAQSSALSQTMGALATGASGGLFGGGGSFMGSGGMFGQSKAGSNATWQRLGIK